MAPSIYHPSPIIHHSRPTSAIFANRYFWPYDAAASWYAMLQRIALPLSIRVPGFILIKFAYDEKATTSYYPATGIEQ